MTIENRHFKASVVNGHIPGLLKATIIIFTVNYAILWIVVVLPGLAVMQSLCATHNFALNGPMTPTSNDCSGKER